MVGHQDPTVPGVAPPSTGPLLEPGDVFGDYEIVAELGRGGMGAVYRARHRTLARTVALKILLPCRRDSLQAVERFLREARSLAQLDHHNVVGVHHVGVVNGTSFIDMQYVEGEPLSERLKAGPLDVQEAVQVVEQVAHALSHAHRKRIVHRDVKPANVLLTADGVVKVVDFGLARPVDVEAIPEQDATRTASAVTICGTPQYMAPEQWSGHAPDARSDQYALGVTFYHLVTGRPPFSGDITVQMRQHLADRPAPAHHLNTRVPESVSRIISRLMEKDPANRFPSCDDLVTELRLLLRPRVDAPAPALAPAPTDAPIVPLPRTDHQCRSLLVGAAVAAAVLAAQLGGTFRGLELRGLDARFAWTRGFAGASPVVVVVADRESKDRLAPDVPLSRERHYGEAIARLAQANARAIGVDLLITERASREEDGGLAAVTGLVPGVVHSIHLATDGARATVPDVAVPEAWSLDLPAAGLPEARRLDLPVPEVAAATSRVGHVALAVDPDGVVRRVPLLIAYRGRVYPSLSLATAMTALGIGRDGVRLADGALTLRRPDGSVVRVPVDARGEMLVNFRWRERTLAEYALWKLVEPGVLEPTVLGERVALIGSQLDGDSDVGALPGRPLAPLVWAHAFALDTILSGSFVVPLGELFSTLLVILAGLGSALAAGVLRPAAATATVTGAATAYWGTALLAFGGETRLALPLLAPTLAGVLGYGASTLARHWAEEREKRALAGALSRYLSPAVTRRVLREPEGLRLGGRRKELTVLCAEVDGFSDLSERLEPEEIDAFLAAFFSAVTDVVFKYEGTLDHFTGQGVRAFFGDPEPQEDHALRGVRCAVEMRGRAADVVQSWARDGRPALQVGIGVHTGYVTVGNVGSLQRMEYTVIGRNVDQAARLARAEPGRILVSPRTRALTAEAVTYEARSGADGRPTCFEALTAR